MRDMIERIIFGMAYICFLPILMIITLLTIKKRDTLIWGTAPIINNKYWSASVRAAGHKSVTLMRSYYSINKREDFDLYFEDIVPGIIKGKIIRKGLGPLFAFHYVVKNGSVIHMPFEGGTLAVTSVWWAESWLLKLAQIKTVIITYGSDGYMYSKVKDKSLLYGLLASYPDAARNETAITRRVRHWEKYADIVITHLMTVEGFSRWDVTANQVFIIDTNEWTSKEYYSDADGVNGEVKIIHTPNHRGFKGTEFIVHAIEELKKEGLNVKLILMEKQSNESVRIMMKEVDVLVEQIIFPMGYAISGIEGMASGLPVVSNLSGTDYTTLFNRYAFLSECPIYSTTPENIKDHLRVLITNPELRKELGRCGRQYTEKYHSYAMGQYLFGAIYDKILYGKEVDLMNLFHPLKSEYNKRTPYVEHPFLKERYK